MTYCNSHVIARTSQKPIAAQSSEVNACRKGEFEGLFVGCTGHSIGGVRRLETLGKWSPFTNQSTRKFLGNGSMLPN